MKKNISDTLDCGLTEHLKMKLELEVVQIPELAEEIDFQKHFTGNKEVEYCMGGYFLKYVLNPAKKVSSLPAMFFNKHKFMETIYDIEIMDDFKISKSAGLMSPEEILWTITYLTSKQPRGKAGTLQTDGSATIIGYMLCDGVIRAVCVAWRSDRGGWYCRCLNLDHYWLVGCDSLN